MRRDFSISFPLRFAHCDSAGIAYYPRYFELCDAAVEDWTDFALAATRRTLHFDLGLALPTVSLQATFSAPSYLGDLLGFRLSVLRVGNSSVVLETNVTSAGEQRLCATQTLVLMHMNTAKSTPWPARWRERLVELQQQESLV